MEFLGVYFFVLLWFKFSDCNTGIGGSFPCVVLGWRLALAILSRFFWGFERHMIVLFINVNIVGKYGLDCDA